MPGAGTAGAQPSQEAEQRPAGAGAGEKLGAEGFSHGLPSGNRG